MNVSIYIIGMHIPLQFLIHPVEEIHIDSPVPIKLLSLIIAVNSIANIINFIAISLIFSSLNH